MVKMGKLGGLNLTIIAIVIILVVGALGGVYLLNSSRNAARISTTQSQTLFSQGEVFGLNGQGYSNQSGYTITSALQARIQYGTKTTMFVIPQNATNAYIAGSWTSKATNPSASEDANVTVGILTQAEYAGSEQGLSPSSAFASYGSTHGGTIYTSLLPGTYYLVFVSEGGNQTVSITTPIIVQYVS
jgi:hypothetical protein